MKKLLLGFLLIISFSSFGQENDLKIKGGMGGTFQMGLRSTLSLFSESGGVGYGSGGQFRLQLSNTLNSEWFADFFTSNIEDLGKRSDAHIGWSVMFYPVHKPSLEPFTFTPYILAGHCFDYTRVTPFSQFGEDVSSKTVERWSSATQVGLGTHLHLTSRFDLSLSSQYMIHLGNEIHAEVHETNGVRELHIDEENHAGIEGHLLLTLSLNVRIADLW